MLQDISYYNMIFKINVLSAFGEKNRNICQSQPKCFRQIIKQIEQGNETVKYNTTLQNVMALKMFQNGFLKHNNILKQCDNACTTM